jgi:hypothetical protein
VPAGAAALCKPPNGPPKKCHESETEAGVATRETTGEPQVTQDQHVTGNETLHPLYGLLTDPVGRPVAVRVFPGSNGDLAAFTGMVHVVRGKFGLAKMVMIGDRGMITSARIAALNQLEDGMPRPDAYGWVTALRAPPIKKLIADGGPLAASTMRA